MAGIGDRVECGLDVLPAALVVEGVADCLADEGTASAAANSSIEFSDEIVGKTYVQTHGHNVAHMSPLA
jgi:hypothetical protein